MLRAVLAVALAVALLASARPAIDAVRVAHAEDLVEGALERLDTAAARLRAHNDAVPGPGGARAHVRLHLPRGVWATAGLERLAVRPAPRGAGAVARWRVAGGTLRTRRLPALSLPGDATGVTVREGGRSRLQLALTRLGARRVIRLRRGFTSEGGTSRDHAGTG